MSRYDTLNLAYFRDAYLSTERITECENMGVNTKRKKKVERITNTLALFTVLDSLITFPLLVYIISKELLTEAAALVGSIHICCFSLLSFISAFILLQTRHKYNDRLDAVGALLVVQIINVIGNISMLVLELSSDLSNIWKSITLSIFLIWKCFFIIIELASIPYFVFIIRKTIWYIKTENLPYQPYFIDRWYEEDEFDSHLYANPPHIDYDLIGEGQVSAITSPSDYTFQAHRNHHAIPYEYYEMYMGYTNDQALQSV